MKEKYSFANVAVKLTTRSTRIALLHFVLGNCCNTEKLPREIVFFGALPCVVRSFSKISNEFVCLVKNWCGEGGKVDILGHNLNLEFSKAENKSNHKQKYVYLK